MLREKYKFIFEILLVGIVAQAYNPSSQEAEAEGL
jgi:hypothetical protein